MMIEKKCEQVEKKQQKHEKNGNQSTDKDFQIKHILGRGTFGTVYLARWVSRNKDVAIKSIVKNTKYKNRQIQILSLLKHESIIELVLHYQKYDEVTKKSYSNLVMEYLPTTLFSMIKTANAKHYKLDINKSIGYAYKILEGLAYLEEKNICHRDIKPSNILIDETSGRVKICDFGSAKQLKKGDRSITYICSRYYRAPQLILGCSQYSTKIDIWSAGCVIAEMITALPLFDGSNNLDQIAKIINILGPPTKDDLTAMNVELSENLAQVQPKGLVYKIQKLNSKCPKQFIDLITQLLVYNPDSRLSAKQALQHNIFKMYIKLGQQKF